MAISDTITSMYENVGNVYDILELAGADLTNVDKNIFNLKETWKERLLYFMANGTDTLWNNWLPKVTGSGETITLNNTIEAKMNIVYKGNTSQESTTGKNLFNVNTTYTNSLEEAGITTTFNSDGTITVNGTKNANYRFITYRVTLPAGTYYFSGCPSGGSGGGYSTIVQTTSEISSQVFDIGNGGTFTLTEERIISFYPVRIGADAVTFNNTVFKPMIARVPVTYNDYEPYTGNQPSPSPDYPQDIQVVSGDNTIKVEGKNLFDGIFRQGSRYTTGLNDTNRIFTTQNYPVKSGVIYTISTTLNTSAYKYAINLSTQIYPIPNTTEGNARQYYDSGWKQTNTFTFTPSQDGYLGIVVAKINGTDALTPSDISSYTFMLNEGDTALPYEPYQSASYPISLGNIELCKIGDYQDKIYKDNGKWYLNKQIGKVVLNGSENWVHEAGSQTPTPRTVVTINSINFLNKNYYSNYFILNSTTSNKIVLRTENSHLYLSLENELAGIINSDTNQQKVDKIKSWLSTHNTIVYYVLKTPTYTEITDSTLIYQLEAIKKSYNNQTNISQENSKEAFILDVTALGN